MAYSKRTVSSETPPTRFAFRLNPDRPREKVILDYLNGLKDEYRGSAAIKRALHQMITGCDFDNGQPLLTAGAYRIVAPVQERPYSDLIAESTAEYRATHTRAGRELPTAPHNGPPSQLRPRW